MRYGCTVINATRLGEFLYDKELADQDEEMAEDDGDHSDEKFERMERQREQREWIWDK
jgi:hypothetical protein